jgi:hypothetical protein
MLYLKLFIKKNFLFLLYIVYVICVITLGFYIDINTFFENKLNNNIDLKSIDIETATDIKNKKDVPLYDITNPTIGAFVFLLIELACIFFK